MDESRDLESLRDVARTLRQEPDAAMLARVRANVRARVNEGITPWEVLAGWLRPAAASFAALVLLLAAALAFAPDPFSPADIVSMTGRILIDREASLVDP